MVQLIPLNASPLRENLGKQPGVGGCNTRIAKVDARRKQARLLKFVYWFLKNWKFMMGGVGGWMNIWFIVR